MIKPKEYIFFPTKQGKWLRDIHGKPRVYKRASNLIKNLAHSEYDSVQIYASEDVVSREDLEKLERKSNAE